MVSLHVPHDVIETNDQRRDGFPFRSGSIVLDFVATIAKRDLADRELLTGPDDLARWVHVAGLPVLEKPASHTDVTYARELREAIHRVVRSRVDDSPAAAADLESINGAARGTPPTALLDTAGYATVFAEPVDAPAITALLAREAIELFSGRYAHRIRLCRGHDCSLYFVDRSRPGNRVWCSMGVCGAKQSSARYRARSRLVER
ncbi:CGNR zinc finger domain-containing protein [Gordonia sp. DT30]|uniref:CGNR zinc finger domain-containing protein n=1 Tax=unclassified Gordonia (in: high G+C Gram-positive bacteria) TaxID=2657482 RepID=UPI003CF31916